MRMASLLEARRETLRGGRSGGTVTPRISSGLTGGASRWLLELCQLEDDKTLLISRAAPYSLRLVTNPASLALPRPRQRTIISSLYPSPPAGHSPKPRDSSSTFQKSRGSSKGKETLREFSLERGLIPAGNKEMLRWHERLSSQFI